MEAEKFIHDFWKANEISNFSKEATVLFFYLIYVWENEIKPDVFYVHPASLLCKVRGFSVKGVLTASEELQERGYITYKAPDQQWCSGQYSLCFDREVKSGKSENPAHSAGNIMNAQNAKP